MHETKDLLWSKARELFAAMCAEIGAASAIAAFVALERKQRRAILDWLVPLEALARKLLLIDAAALTLPAPRPRAQHTKAARPRRTAAFSIPIPSTLSARTAQPRIRALDPVLVKDIWREQARRARIAALKAQRATSRRPAPQRFADRIAALARVLDNPMPHAKRLARRLRRMPRPRLVARHIANTLPPPQRCGRCYVPLQSALWLARESSAAFCNTS